MKTLNNYITLVFIGALISSTSCKKEEINLKKIKTTSTNDLKKNTSKQITSTASEELYHYSETKNKKYDYQITGKDENGKNVKGVINLETEIGIGVVKKEDDTKEIEIISEHISSNRIIATDMNGFQYRLKLDYE